MSVMGSRALMRVLERGGTGSGWGWGKLSGSQAKGTWRQGDQRQRRPPRGQQGAGGRGRGGSDSEAGCGPPRPGPGRCSPWTPIMCSRMRTLSARIFKASRSCCTPSPWWGGSSGVRDIPRQRAHCPVPPPPPLPITITTNHNSHRPLRARGGAGIPVHRQGPEAQRGERESSGHTA